jgi:hypothetical protein
MNEQINVSLMVLLCASLAACDDSERFDDPGDQLQVTEPAGFGVSMARSIEPAATASAAIEIELPTFANPAPSNHALVDKVKSPTAELAIGWMRWGWGLPDVGGPIADPTGEACALGQEGDVWYLAGTAGVPVVRECDVPAGKQLFFPLINYMNVFPPEYFPDLASIEAVLPDGVAWYDNVRANICDLTLRIDGQEVRPGLDELDEDFYIRVMDPFEIELHEDHWSGGAVMPAVGHGYYALVNPLPPGDHVIEFGGVDCEFYMFETSATYLLHIGN